MKTKAKVKGEPAKTRGGRDLSGLPPGCEALLGRDDVARAIGVSLRTLDAMLATERFPPPDFHVGPKPRWRVETYNGWVRAQSRPGG